MLGRINARKTGSPWFEVMIELAQPSGTDEHGSVREPEATPN
jgi:hypothetical protein